MKTVKEYAAALAGLNGEAVAIVRGDAATIANWERDGQNVGLVWAALREAGHDEATITQLQKTVKNAIPPWWAEFQPDEAGQSDAFLQRYGEEWDYIPSLGCWYKWNGTHWQTDETRRFRLELGRMLDDVHKEAMEIARELFREAEAMAAGDDSTLGDDEDTKAAKAAAKEAYARAMAWRRTDRRLNAVGELCKDRRAVYYDALNVGNLLNLANGTLDLDRYTIRPHERGDLLTHCLPYAFDPAATCPRWLQFLGEVLVKEDGHTTDPDLVALFQEAVGYALTVETRYEAMFWLSGGGQNGKSTALRVCYALLGPLAMKLDFSALARPDGGYYLANLGGMRLVYSLEAAPRTGEETIKQIVSGEPITARPIHGKPITIRPVAKVLWAMNDKPNINDKSDGFWRRLRLIPFYRQFTEQEKDVHLADKLLAELPGILNWALDGLRRLRTNGRFTDAAAVRAAVAEYRTNQNDVALWLNERTTHALPEADRPAGARTTARTAFGDYLQWAKEANKKYTLTETTFGREMKRLVEWSKPRATVYHIGLLAMDDTPAHHSDTEANERAALTSEADGSNASDILAETGL